jgi:membrane protease YdiL (CAAX protease family)
MTRSDTSAHSITWSGILPGLLFILALDVAYWLGGPVVRGVLERFGLVWSAAFIALPVAYVVSSGRSWRDLGYRRQGARRYYVWGLGIGAVWRLLDLLLAFGAGGTMGLSPGGAVTLLGWLFNGLILVPLLEETFFRGYLQAGLEDRLGPLPAIVLQAALFAGHPYHAVQGPLKVSSIALFGVIAGVLYWRTRSIASVYGAHGMANVLPRLVTALGAIIW